MFFRFCKIWLQYILYTVDCRYYMLCLKGQKQCDIFFSQQPVCYHSNVLRLWVWSAWSATSRRSFWRTSLWTFCWVVQVGTSNGRTTGLFFWGVGHGLGWFLGLEKLKTTCFILRIGILTYCNWHISFVLLFFWGELLHGTTISPLPIQSVDEHFPKFMEWGPDHDMSQPVTYICCWGDLLTFPLAIVKIWINLGISCAK